MIHHIDQRRGEAGPSEVSVQAGQLVRKGPGGPEHTLRLADIVEIRLSVDRAGRGSQIVCGVTDRLGRTLSFASMRWTGAGDFEPNALTFKALLGELHGALTDRHDDIRFVEGPPTGQLMRYFGLASALTLASLAGFAWIFLAQENRYGLLLVPLIMLGGWLMRVFRPRSERRYDPDTYASKPVNEEELVGEN
ncbi:hypothetical protein [Maricaulis sp. CAU 1757]